VKGRKREVQTGGRSERMRVRKMEDYKSGGSENGR
jgi:hypothetical protein